MTLFKKIILTIVVIVSFLGQAQQLFNINNQAVFGGDNIDVNVGVIQMNDGTYLSYGSSESSSYSGNTTSNNNNIRFIGFFRHICIVVFLLNDVFMINLNQVFPNRAVLPFVLTNQRFWLPLLHPQHL